MTSSESGIERGAGLASPPNFDRESGADFDPQAGPEGVRDRGHNLNSSLSGEGADARQGARNSSVTAGEESVDRAEAGVTNGANSGSASAEADVEIPAEAAVAKAAPTPRRRRSGTSSRGSTPRSATPTRRPISSVVAESPGGRSNYSDGLDEHEARPIRRKIINLIYDRLRTS